MPSTFITIGGIDLEVQVNDAVRGPNTTRFEMVRNARGQLIGHYPDDGKLTLSFTTGPMTESDAAALRTMLAAGGFFACSGAMLPGGSISASVSMGVCQYLNDWTDPHVRTYELELRQV
jgi:hypothetical protein